jgi:hypothetical protein
MDRSLYNMNRKGPRGSLDFIKRLIPGFELPLSLQGYNDSPFFSQIAQGLSKALVLN